jgi:hypothetical protein
MRRDSKNTPVIWVGWKQKYFCAEGWTGGITLIQLDKFVFSRTALKSHLVSEVMADPEVANTATLLRIDQRLRF